MQIVSSIFSFVDFNEPPETCNPEVMPIPAVNDFGIKFQFTVLDATEDLDLWVVPYGGNPITDVMVQADVLCGVLAKKTYHVTVPAITLLDYLYVYDCYQYAIYDGNPTMPGAVLLALSNPFQVTPASCWLSKMEYWSEENFADFNYADPTKKNTVWLFMHLRNPTNPTKETRYIESTGKRRLLSAVMDEEYELKTDSFTQWLHRKIEIALLHDYIKITNSNVGFVNEVLSKNATYTKDWQDDLPGINISPAKCRMIKNLSYTNSNCGESDCACTEPPTPEAFEFLIYKDELLTKRAGSLLIGQTGEGTLTILPASFDTAHGSVVLNANGSFVYTPDEAYTGADSFNYSLQNECGTGIGTITINIKEMEPGFIMEWGGLPSAIPDGWLLCDGTAISRATYAPLFGAIGVLHGAGNGTTTFNLPTVKKQAVVGYDVATAGYDTVGFTGGSNLIGLTIENLPAHDFKMFADTTGTDGVAVLHENPERAPVSRTNDDTNRSYSLVTSSTVTEATIGKTSTVGSGQEIDIRNAFVVLPYIIKT